jgi:DNA-binding transcriptional LysR family regulator
MTTGTSRTCPASSYSQSVDLDAVRTFVAVVDAGQFQAAGDELGISQQAVSKRIAALERKLAVQLFARSARGVLLSVDGQAFLPHARELLRAEERAIVSVLPGRRALRVDVLNRRIAPATLLHAFYQQHPGIDLDVVTLPDGDVESALDAVAAGTIDATFRALLKPKQQLTGTELHSARFIKDRHEILVGPRHRFANSPAVTLSELAGHPIWMPGLQADTEAGAYYAELAAVFGLTIDVIGPVFGAEVLLTELAESPTLATFIGEGSRYLWPANYDLRRIPVTDPVPVFPLSIVWRRDNAHPGLASLLAFLKASYEARTPEDEWLPKWAR